jgi:hypothetical protein
LGPSEMANLNHWTTPSSQPFRNYHELWWTGMNVMKEPDASIFRVVDGDKWGSMVGDSEGKGTARARPGLLVNQWKTVALNGAFPVSSTIFLG